MEEAVGLDFETLVAFFDQLLLKVVHWASSPQFYAQAGLVLLAIILAWTLASTIRRHSSLLREPPAPGGLQGLRTRIYQTRDLIFPLLLILMLAMASDFSNLLVQQSWLVQLGQGGAVVFMLYTLLGQLIRHRLARSAVRWVAIPVAVLHIFGWLDDVTAYLDSLALEVGNIKLSAYGVVRVLIFGSLLFWLGRVSSSAGQRLIRSQEDLDLGTREVFAKLFQVVLFVVVFILLLQLLGINLTALAVFGGALGVGLGFGLQSIASNFISGVILLLERSLTVGDFIELEDGRAGTIRELNMRSTTLETFDGKDIMVPNETFVTTAFTNWTHKNKKQRYSLEFQVAYKTDLELLFGLVRDVVASHPSVLSGEAASPEERPDAEIASFGDSGVNILVEFWMEGIDDGRNRVGADLLLMIWYALKEHDIEIPFPQREIKVVDAGGQGG
ncbi:mechanosensitive ion channel family protein [Motiliproteus sp. SC1-56]|uniref:mechanosensitive ion channel family protein n=1 Tax=Motiliproteus sp. SC1-56 TaxID=2799565 RepID=UPI001F5C2583|nr:mechanosensitive ion channel domain-containing protein [Motiliproteus sp. SC1-56]